MRWLCRMSPEIRNDSAEVIDEAVYVHSHPRAPSFDLDLGRVASFELTIIRDAETRFRATKMCESIAIFVVKDLFTSLARHESI